MRALNYYLQRATALTAATLTAWLLTTTTGLSGPQDKAFYWGVRHLSPGVSLDSDYHNLPHAGHDYSAAHQYNVDTYNALYNNGYLMGLMLHNDTAPITGTKDNMALDTVMGYVQRLDYVFADFELGSHETNKAEILEMVDQVRNSANVNCRDAFIGNYQWFPGNSDLAYQWPSGTDRTTQSNDYLSSGMDVAMPACYPYEYFEVHANSGIWGANISPNKRSALFWAPLERYSTAKRALPAGHQLIPWIGGFVPWTGYDAPEPTRTDCRGLLQHMRLRGADGYYGLISWNSNYIDEDDYMRDVIDAWRDLEEIFAADGVKSVINLSTDKTGGLEWSGIRNINKIMILVSNLGNSDAQATYPDKWNLPASSAIVTAGQHQIFNYTITNLLDNGDFNSDSAGWYLLTGKATLETTGGIDDSGCLKLQGGNYSMLGTYDLHVEPNALMNISYYAKGESGARFKMNYYYYDAAGQGLGYSSAQVDIVPSATYQQYENTFTIPNNPDIVFIRPILYNSYGDTDPNDIIWVDDMVIKFGSPNLLVNNDFNAGSDNWYLLSGKATWENTAGLSGSGCLKLQGGQYSVLGIQDVAATANAQMKVSYYAKGESGAELQINYYYYDAAGQSLGYATAQYYTPIAGTYRQYEAVFTIPDNPAIVAIRPILYNRYGATDPNDIIWVDNISISTN
ncbi:MAG: carbohydrate binding domain-containing protein [Victivallaceae bacterium]|nr:carbohydrate binding domain-containing protein [Victivallaceae bacterium]